MTPKRLLFISWDSGSSNYLESLFFPILAGLQERGYSCHVLQFSWASPTEVQRLGQLARQLGIPYSQVPIHRKPHAGLGALWTVYTGVARIKDYIQTHQIEILMPRSIMPAMMVNRLHSWLRRTHITIIYDADGLSIEERVDFSGLKKGSLRYLRQKKEEKKILQAATKVLTRSQKAIAYLQADHGMVGNGRFYVVSNGRDAQKFTPDANQRNHWRRQWGLEASDLLMAYTGSLGAPYAWEEMLSCFERLKKVSHNAQFLILTREAKENIRIPKHLETSIRIINGAFAEIPGYLSAADLGISLRQQAPSLQGLAPIKIGEYLLMGLPLILSPGIGDTQENLQEYPFVWIDDSLNSVQLEEWFRQIPSFDSLAIRDVGMRLYSLEHSIASYERALGE